MLRFSKERLRVMLKEVKSQVEKIIFFFKLKVTKNKRSQSSKVITNCMKEKMCRKMIHICFDSTSEDFDMRLVDFWFKYDYPLETAFKATRQNIYENNFF